ncbi:MAG: hypothetical protein INH34_00955 [Phycisphaerales bacterium]|jgi:hypothetical protein|nr:hypothetical protein [Phycisphaerales bacterium]
MTANVPYRLRVGDLVGRSLAVYVANLLPFLLLSAIAYAPGLLLMYVAVSSELAVVAVVAGVVSALAGQMLTGALTYAVVQKLRGESATLAEVVSVGVRSLLRVLILSIVVGICIGLGTVLFIVPGVILAMWFYVAVPAAVVERLGLDAMGRSRTLTDGSRWPIFGAVVLIVIASGGIGWLTTQLTSEAGMVRILLEYLVSVVIGPLGAAMAATCYFLLRVGKESVDAKQIAAVFD